MADYVYAGTKAKTLETKLLTENQVEMLVGAPTIQEFYKNLEDTFIAPYLAEHNKTKELSEILELSIEQAKKDLMDMIPNPALLTVLWIKYDFYNLKAIIKGDIANTSEKNVLSLCFQIGLYNPKDLYNAYHNQTLGVLDKRLSHASDEALAYKKIADIDLILNRNYLTTARHISQHHKNTFISNYVTRLIDLFNLRAGLRTHGFGATGMSDVFIEGGTFHRRELDNEEHILSQFKRCDTPELWQSALDEYHTTGSFALIDKTAEDSVNNWLKTQSYELFSLAPLFAYFAAIKNNAQMIRAVYVGKITGLTESEIRRTLRILYT